MTISDFHEYYTDTRVIDSVIACSDDDQLDMWLAKKYEIEKEFCDKMAKEMLK